MGNACICIATLLLSLTGGMFLLAKAKKDSLGIFYNVVAWFIIVLALGTIFCCGIRCVAGRACGSGHNKEMMRKGGSCKEERMMQGCCCKKMCMKKMMCEEMEEHEADGKCMMGKMNMQGEEMKMDCCKGKGKKECVKDSVVIKK